MTGEKVALIRLGPDIVKDDITTLVPTDKSVLEIIRRRPPRTQCFMEHCITLRQRGYKFCLNDFKHDEAFSPFLQLAEFVQISVSGNDRAKIAENVSLVKKLSAKHLASGVNSDGRFQLLFEPGF